MSLWYALSVRARSEHGVAREIAPRVDEVFVPARLERRAWSDRVVTCEAPLFPGYVFVRLSLVPERRIALLKCRGVKDFVGRVPGDPRIARAVDDAEIEALRIVVAADRALDPVERLVSGRAVYVAAGPLRGVRGIVEHGPDARRRLVVQVALLGRGVRTVLCADDVIEAVDAAA